jgi:putative transposase
MKLVYCFDINNDNRLLELFKISKDLYNQSLYEIKTSLKEDKFIFYNELEKIMKTKTNLENEVNYRKLKAQVSQQILMLLDKNIKSYFRSIKDWKKDNSKYKGTPKLPGYKKKYNLLIYPNQSCQIIGEYLILSKSIKIHIPQFEKYKTDLKSFNQVRIIPKNGHIKIEIVYEKETENKELIYSDFAAIDLGINNLITMVSKNNPLILSGRQIKSLNQNFNKCISHLQTIKDKQKIKTTKQIQRLYENREYKLKDIFHKISRFIVNYLIKNKIGNLIIGYNKNWKDSISMGKKNNQNFAQISHLRLLNYLKYKCELVGIKYIETTEAYTSKCDGLNLEAIGRHEKYSGARIKRGLFKSAIGKLINADINGALNIMRKVVGDSRAIEIINRGLLFNPIKIRNLYNINSNFLLRNLINFRTSYTLDGTQRKI